MVRTNPIAFLGKFYFIFNSVQMYQEANVGAGKKVWFMGGTEVSLIVKLNIVCEEGCSFLNNLSWCFSFPSSGLQKVTF